MSTFATLGIEFTSRTAAQAARDLDAVEGAAGRAESRTDSLAGKSRRLATDILGVGTNSRKATDDLEGMGRGTKKATDELTRMNSTAEVAGTVLGRLTAIVGTYLGAKAIVEMADSWSDMRSQLGAATNDMEGASEMMERMVDIANASYSPLDQTVQSYARNVAVLRDLGKSADEAADFTEALNHMLVISATKGERAASVQNALSKAMAVGKLQADGLETVLASSTSVSEALANELGTTVSGLRDMASQGKITGQVIADAIINPLDEVRQKAGEMPATVGDALVRVGTNLMFLIGVFDEAASGSETLAGGIIAVADWIGELAKSGDFEAFTAALSAGATLAGQALLVLAATRIPALIGAMVAAGATAKTLGATFLWQYYGVTTLTGGLGLLRGALAMLGGPLGVAFAALGAIGLAWYNSVQSASQYSRAAADAATAQEALNGAMDAFHRMQSAETWRQAMEGASSAIKAIQEEIALIEAQVATPGGSMPGSFGMVLDPALQGALDQANEKLGIAQSHMALLAATAGVYSVSMQTTVQAAAALNAEQLKAYQSAMDMLTASQRRIELLEIEQQYGKESVAYAVTALGHERDIYWAKLQTLDVADSIRNTLMEAWWEEQRLLGKTTEWDAVMGILEDTAGDVLAVLKDIGATEPGASWLDTAIAKAGALWGALSGAAAALGAIAGENIKSPQNTGSTDWYKNKDGLALSSLYMPQDDEKGGKKGGGGGGKSPVEEMKDRLKDLEENFASQYELAMQHYARDQATLKWALDNKLMSLEEYNDKVAMLQIDTWGAEWEKNALQYEMDQNALQGALDNKLISYEDYYRKLKELQWANLLSEDTRSDLAQDLSNYSQYFSQLYSMTGSSLDGLLKLQQGFSAASALMSAWEGYAKALKDGGATPWMRLMWAGKVLSAGLGAVRAIKGASAGGGGGSAGGTGISGATQSAPPETPLRISADAFDPAQLYTGEAVQRWFDAIQTEAGNRGITWVPV